MKLVSNRPAWKSASAMNALVQRNRGVDSFHDEHLERALHAADGFGAVAAVGDQLGHQRIVKRRDHAIGVRPGVHAHADPAGQMEAGDAAGDGTNVSGFSALMRHSMAWPRNSIGPGRHFASGSPCAMRIWLFTMSMPVTNSVTGCSTCMRALTSMK